VVTRLKRVVLHRLLPLVAAVVLGTAGAVFWTNASNAAIRPTFQAVAMAGLPAPETETGTGRSSSEVQNGLAEAQAAAIEANADFIDANHLILSTLSTQSIDFTVTAGTPEEAAEEAAEMRDRYLVATAPAPVETRMEEVLAKAHVVREQLNTLLPAEEAIPSDPLVAAQRALLNGQISSLTSESAQLSVALVLADTEGEKAAIQEDIDTILAQIVALRTQLQALPLDATADAGGRSVTDESAGSAGRDTDPVLGDTNDAVDDQFAIESLQSLYLSLQAEFQMLYIESTNVVPAQISEVEVTDITPDPIPLPVAVGTGLVGLLLLGIGVILVNDRLRPRWWTQADLAGVLAEAPDRRVRATEPWYWNNPSGPRKLAIQKVAVNFLPSIEMGPVAVGVVGLATQATALRALSVDLAASMVTAGRSSLVIDTTGLEEEIGAEPWQLFEGGPLVADLLNPWRRNISEAEIAKAVVDAGELWPGLSVIPSGGPSLYSIEGAMTPVAGKLLDNARELFDLTLVPITERGTALSDALVRNLDAVLIVGSGGKTTIQDAETLTRKVTANGGRVLGSVLLLEPARRKIRELFRGKNRPSELRPEVTMNTAPAVAPRAWTTARHSAFDRHGMSEVVDKDSISDSFDTGGNIEGSPEAVEVRAVNESNGDPSSSSKDGNGGRPRLTAVLASHPDARRRSDD
jgi:hypothetical protein